MTVHCSNCANVISPFACFCPYCGAEAPRRTIAAGLKPKKITDGIFCPHCGDKNVKDALFCAACGLQIHQRPGKNSVVCPRCGEKNKINSNNCFKCVLSFTDWYAMEGEFARALGFSGNFILHESMTDRYYHFLSKVRVTLGRSNDNTISIPCAWVSAHHCEFDLEKWQVTDLNSTNGIYVNRQADRIKKLSLSDIYEFNVAGTFTFRVIQEKKIFTFRLTAVLDEKEAGKMGSIQGINELRKHNFIFLRGDGEFIVRKMDGEILTSDADRQEYFAVRIEKGRYYFNDPERDISNRLLLAKYNNLPCNWELNLL